MEHALNPLGGVLSGEQVTSHHEVLVHRERWEGTGPTTELDDADLHPELRFGQGYGLPVEAYHTPIGHPEPADHP